MAEEKIKTALSPGHPLGGERVRRIPPSSTIENLENPNNDKIKIYSKIVRIATWNTRSLFMAGKLANLECEMNRMNIDIMGLSEVRWPNSGKQKTKRGTIYYSGGTDPDHRYGTAILVSDKISKSVTEFIPLSDRVMMLKLQTTHRNLNIIQIYAPTNDKSDQEIEEFYNQVDEMMRLTKKGEINLVIGDFNAKVGCGSEGDSVGTYGLGTRNERGDRLVQFCVENNLIIANTFFKLHPRKLYTWRSPADKEERIVRNQIDFILIGTEFKKYIKSVKTYPGADINSDHNPVVMDFKLRRFLNIKRKKISKQIDFARLNNIEKKQEISLKIETELEAAVSSTSEEEEIEATWNIFKNKITTIEEQDIGYKRNDKKQEWMTQEILDLMNERRRLKKKQTKYKQLNKTIRKKCREAKEQWMSTKCQEIEELQTKYDSFNLHKKVKEMTGRHKRQHTSILRDRNNEIITGIDAKLERWHEYIDQLFNDERTQFPPSHNIKLNEKGPDISKHEVIHAIRSQKNRKATGPDKIHAETLKLIADYEGKSLDLITSLFNKIYSSGKIPSDWLKSTFITLPKKPNASQCDDHRMISLMSHVLKTFLRIVHTRIYRKCEQQMDNTQFGFRNGLGTREALFSLKVLTQRCRDMNVNVYACFIDYRKAFDCVNHEKMIEVLAATGIDEQDLRIISELYWRQTAAVNIEQNTSDEILIRRGVRQGCVLSPLLFNLYSEAIFREALDGTNGGIKINGTNITNIRYADDTVVIASSTSELQNMVDRIVHYSDIFGLQLNVAKTKTLAFSKTATDVHLSVNGKPIEQVDSLKYLGAIINSQCNPRNEILSRIEQARKTFMSMRVFFTRSDLSLELRTRMMRCYIFSVLLYGCESWTLDAQTEKKLEAFEMYVYRRMLRISWVQKITNKEVLNRMHKSCELLDTLKQRKMQYLGHIMRGERYEFLRLIIEGKVEGKRSVGRRQNSWLKDLRRWFNRSSIEIFRAAVSRATVAIWIANLRKEKA